LGVCGIIGYGSYYKVNKRAYTAAYNSGYEDGVKKITEKAQRIDWARSYIMQNKVVDATGIQKFKEDTYRKYAMFGILKSDIIDINRSAEILEEQLNNVHHWSNFHYDIGTSEICKICEKEGYVKRLF
jgi:hypothetical protein